MMSAAKFGMHIQAATPKVGKLCALKLTSPLNHPQMQLASENKPLYHSRAQVRPQNLGYITSATVIAI